MSQGFDADDVAGIVDLFGALTREELAEALSELAYRKDVSVPDPDELIEDAIDSFALVAFRENGAERTLLAPGPNAFPTLPDGSEDLPHILDVEPRQVDREAVDRAAEVRFRRLAARAIEQEDRELLTDLLDVSYDLETWGNVELQSARSRLDDVRDTIN